MSGDIIEFRTRDQRTETERKTWNVEAQNEAFGMLEAAMNIVKEEGEAAGRRITGVAIALVMSDGSYATLIPQKSVDYSRLLGALEEAKYRILRHTDED